MIGAQVRRAAAGVPTGPTGDPMFVVTAAAGTNRVGVSSNGIDWTTYTSAQAASVGNAVCFGGGQFVSVLSGNVYTSPDGVTWTARTAAASNSWQSVTYGDGLFVAVSSNGTNRVMTSPDGITWTARSAAEANWWQSVTYGDGLFVAVSYTGTNRVMTSPDGITWTARSAAGSWYGVAYGLVS